MSVVKCILILRAIGNFPFLHCTHVLCIYMYVVGHQPYKTFVDEMMLGTGPKKSAKAYKKVFDQVETFWQSESVKLFSVQ